MEGYGGAGQVEMDVVIKCTGVAYALYAQERDPFDGNVVYDYSPAEDKG